MLGEETIPTPDASIEPLSTSMTNQETLSRRERQIMQVVYAEGAVTIKQVAALIDDPPSLTALRTTLGILVTKGWLVSKSVGREKSYSPKISKQDVSRVELQNVLKTFFGGSIENLLVSHFADPDSQLDDESLERLQALIERSMDASSNPPDEPTP